MSSGSPLTVSLRSQEGGTAPHPGTLTTLTHWLSSTLDTFSGTDTPSMVYTPSAGDPSSVAYTGSNPGAVTLMPGRFIGRIAGFVGARARCAESSDASRNITVGSTVDGKVEKVERFGAFVQLEPGLSGLLPSSKMSIPAGTSASRVFRPGRELKVQIISIDARRRRISLGLEGDGAEGSRSDFEAYRSSQADGSGGFNALAAALSKIQP